MQSERPAPAMANYAIEPGQRVWSSLVLSETLFVALVAAMLWFALRYERVGRLLYLLLAILLGTMAYSGIFLLISLIFRKRAMVIGIMYGVVLEGLLSMVPAMVNLCTVTYYLRSLTVALVLPQDELNKLPLNIVEMLGGADGRLAMVVLLNMAFVFVSTSCLLASTREYAVKDQP